MPVGGFRNKYLEEFFRTGRSRRISQAQWRRIMLILDFLDGIAEIKDCQGVMGFHPLKGDRAGTYAMTVTGNWRLTFGWNGKDVIDVDYEDYH